MPGRQGTERPLTDQVRAWLHRGGIPLEYEVARVFASVGFDVAQGTGYVTESPTGRTSREVDVVARHGGGFVTVRFVIECKHTTAKPWVVLTNERPLSSKEVFQAVLGPEEIRQSLVRLLVRSRGRQMPRFFYETLRPGFSVAVADELFDDDNVDTRHSRNRDDRSQAINAMSQAVSAARSVANARDGWDFVWPVVVIDGPLFAISYTPDGEEELEEIDRKRVLWHANPFGSPAVLDIVRNAALPAYVAEASEALRAVSKYLNMDYVEFYSSENLDEYGQPKPLSR